MAGRRGAARLIMDPGSELAQNLAKWDRHVSRAQMTAAGRIAGLSESWMKSNASWTDRTANARNGLAARPVQDGKKIGVVLFHQVPYGIYLENRWDGKYAVLAPAVARFGPQFIDLVGRLVMTKPR